MDGPRHVFQRFWSSDVAGTAGLAAVVGAVTGLGAVAFIKFISICQRLFFEGGAQAFSGLRGWYIVLLPVIGGFISKLLMGGDQIGSLTLSRFFAVHVAVLPIITAVFLVGHFWMIRKPGIARPPRWAGPCETRCWPKRGKTADSIRIRR